jgi:hypothetical protein
MILIIQRFMVVSAPAVLLRGWASHKNIEIIYSPFECFNSDWNLEQMLFLTIDGSLFSIVAMTIWDKISSIAFWAWITCLAQLFHSLLFVGYLIIHQIAVFHLCSRVLLRNWNMTKDLQIGDFLENDCKSTFHGTFPTCAPRTVSGNNHRNESRNEMMTFLK